MKRDVGYKGRVRSSRHASPLSIPGWCHCCDHTLTRKWFSLLILCHLRPLLEQSGRELCDALLTETSLQFPFVLVESLALILAPAGGRKVGYGASIKGPIAHQGAKQSTLCNQLHEKNKIIFPEKAENRIETLLLLLYVLCFCTG